MNYKENKQIVFIMSGLFLIFIVCLYAFSLYTPKIKNTATINYSEKLSGFQIGTTAKIEYLTQGNSTASTISILDSNPITSIDQTHILQKAGHYSVNFIIQAPEKKHLDVEMNINKRTNNFQTIISGLLQKSNVSLTVGNQKYYTKIPVDWSGRLTLDLKNIGSFTKNKICLEINGPVQSAPSIICHHVPNMAERQAQS